MIRGVWSAPVLAASVASIEPNLGGGHPLMNWKQAFEGGRYPDADEPTGDERGAALGAALDIARAGAGDQYCDTLRMALEAGDPPANTDVEGKAQIERFVRKILDHAERPSEPILDFWVAYAADTICYRLSRPYADEMTMVIWRLGLRLPHKTGVAEEFYLNRLLREGTSIPGDARHATARISLARHFSELMGADAADALLATEFLSEVHLALFAATQSRRNETRLHAARALSLARTVAGGSPLSSPLYKGKYLNPGKRGDKLGWGLEALADALLLTGYYEQALDTLEWGWKLLKRPTAAQEVELLRRVLHRSRSVGLAT